MEGEKVQHTLRQAPQSRTCAGEVSVCERELIFKSHLHSYIHIQTRRVYVAYVVKKDK